jgi:hypothetical protein
MAKAVRVEITNAALVSLLGLAHDGVKCYHAQVVHNVWGEPTIELVLCGEKLDDAFTVNAGDTIKKGQII